MKWDKWLWRGIGWLLTVGCGILLAAVLWKPCLPFAAGLLFACAVQKPYRRTLSWIAQILCRHNGIKKPQDNIQAGWRYSAAILLVLFWIVVGGAAVLVIGYFILSAFGQLFSWIGDNGTVIGGWISRMIEGILQVIAYLPVPQGIPGENLRSAAADSAVKVLPDLIGGLLSGISAKVSAAVSAVVTALPGLLLFLAVFLIASVYMTVSYDAILAVLRRVLPQRWCTAAAHIKAACGGTVRSILRAYLILAAVTYVLLLTGLFLIGVEHVFVAALVGTLIDILPVFGVGTLLIPWAIISFFMGNPGRGVGLVVLYLVICFVRQALEPRLIGKSAGIHPLAVLFAMYTGGMLLGFAGMIAAPFFLTVIWRGYRMIGGDHLA